MGRRANPLLGIRIGCYTVVQQLPSSQSGHSMWRAKCDCGVIRETSNANLMRHITVKCPHAPPGHRLIGPLSAAVLAAVDELDSEGIIILETSEWKPLTGLAAAIVALRDAATDAAYARGKE